MRKLIICTVMLCMPIMSWGANYDRSKKYVENADLKAKKAFVEGVIGRPSFRACGSMFDFNDKWLEFNISNLLEHAGDSFDVNKIYVSSTDARSEEALKAWKRSFQDHDDLLKRVYPSEPHYTTQHWGGDFLIRFCVGRTVHKEFTDADLEKIVLWYDGPVQFPEYETYRFYSPRFTSHFYTVHLEEKEATDNDANWIYEGIGWRAYKGKRWGTEPLYRFWSNNYKKHFYTASLAERDHLITNDANWAYEGIAYYVFPKGYSDHPKTNPVYRFYSPTQGHFYTTSGEEKDAIIASDLDYIYEGISFQVPQW